MKRLYTMNYEKNYGTPRWKVWENYEKTVKQLRKLTGKTMEHMANIASKAIWDPSSPTFTLHGFLLPIINIDPVNISLAFQIFFIAYLFGIFQ